MTPKFDVARQLIVVSIVSLSLAGAAVAAQNTGHNGVGLTGSECYNRVTENCNAKYPGKDMGDPAYKACIESGLDICDITTAVKGHQPPISKAPISSAPKTN